MKTTAKTTNVMLKENDNFEGFMPSNNRAFELLINNKSAKSFAKKESSMKNRQLDSLLTKLYLAL
ncbi:MAG TPA: hypothetical protein ENN43_04310 [bacterium]|nr:hypothetical protein [bacterium]